MGFSVARLMQRLDESANLKREIASFSCLRCVVRLGQPPGSDF